MDKFLKRKAGAAPSGAVLEKRYVFVIAPGAGGGDCPELVDALGSIGRTESISKWPSTFPGRMAENVSLLERTATAARSRAPAGSTTEVVLVGHSFGCRVICELLAKDATQRWPAILTSYPLFGPSKPKTPGTDRVATLKKLPSTARLLFVSGENDEFLRRDWVEGATGIAALRAALEEAPCTSRVVVVDGAKHNVLKVAKSRALAARGTLLSAVRAYLAQGEAAASSPSSSLKKAKTTGKEAEKEEQKASEDDPKKTKKQNTAESQKK